MSTATTLPEPLGPPALGLQLAPDVDVDGDGWVRRALWAPEGLDGPTGILQGGLAAGLAVPLARTIDAYGAPTTAVSSRLHAPTPLGRWLQVRLRERHAATYDVEVHDEEQLLVTSEVELAGHDPTPFVGDLLELATVPLPEPTPNEAYPHCWVCGAHPRHPHAQRAAPAWHAEHRIVTPWLPPPELADGTGHADDLVVAAMLDCPTAWAAWQAVGARGDGGAVLGGFHVQWFAPVATYEPLRTVAMLDEVDGRKMRTRAALVDEDGVCYALASALQISVAEIPSR